MSAVIWDWVGLLLRWAHVMLGIAWIGTSFHFIWLDASLRREADQPTGVSGGSWMVHGGGFYHARKFLVAPPSLPKELHWFKYDAYFTWISGFLLLGVVYYVGAEEFLIDPAVMPLSVPVAIALSIGGLSLGWLGYDALCRSRIGENTGLLALCVFVMAVAAAYGFSQVFSGRAAFIHVGAFLGTIMAANVFFIIIPNQKKVVADLIAGRAPDPRLGKIAKQRSLHNNYLTLARRADDDQQSLSAALPARRQLGLCRGNPCSRRPCPPFHKLEGRRRVRPAHSMAAAGSGRSGGGADRQHH